MKKHKMEKDLLKGSFFHLRENDFTITKKIVPKSYERTNTKVIVKEPFWISVVLLRKYLSKI